MSIADLARRVGALGGGARVLLAMAAGAVASFAMPPYGVFPALIVAATLAVWLLDGTVNGAGLRAGLKASAWIGWCFGFGFFVAGLWWLGAAFLVDNDEFAWALPLGVLGLPAGLALFTASGFVIARLLWVPCPLRIVALSAGLAIADYARGHLFTGFPWNTFGMALGDLRWVDQAASVVGLYGLGLFAVLIAASPASLGDSGSVRARFVPPLLGAAFFMALAAYGVARVPAGSVAGVPGVTIRIMQPNLPQDHTRFTRQRASDIMRHYLTLSDGPDRELSEGQSKVTHVLWPESAFPFLLAREPAALAQIAGLLPPGAVLVTGAARAPERLPGEFNYRFFNAIQVVSDEGSVVGSFDKLHLVPFGEYLPLASLLERLGLRQFVHVPGGFTAGSGPRRLDVPGLPLVAPLICYEAIFPGEVVERDGERPGVLVNVTNDAWFGSTPGPSQHFAQARLRTIEEGLPMIRSANTGISAAIDPYGRIVKMLSLDSTGILDVPLPEAIAPTLYARFHDLAFLLMLVCAVSLMALTKAPCRSPLAGPTSGAGDAEHRRDS